MIPKRRETEAMERVAPDRLRAAIIEEERLRLGIERDEAFRNRNPAAWRQVELTRRTANKDTTEINRRLRALGLTPMRLSPSLGLRRQELRHLQARNAAIVAALGADRRKSGANPDGTKLARPRRRRA